MKIAFGVIVYEASFKFHKDFIDSINNQDMKDFDVLLLNDDLDGAKYEILINEIKFNVVKIEKEEARTIPELRIELIKNAKEKSYDLLILGDFDDTFSKNRVSKIATDFDSDYSFYYNELYYMNTKKLYFEILPTVIENIRPIIESNFLGLSNSAINLNKINYTMIDSLKTKQTVTFDWLFFSFLLQQGHKGKRIDNCKTYYRLHGKNTAGEYDDSIKALKKEIDLKIDHYSKLMDNDLSFTELHEFYYNLRDSFAKHSKLLQEISLINNHYWWGRLNKNIIMRSRINED